MSKCKSSSKFNAKTLMVLVLSIIVIGISFKAKIVNYLHNSKDTTYVCDSASDKVNPQGMIDDNVEAQLNALCKEVEDKTEITIVVDTNDFIAEVDYDKAFDAACDKIHKINNDNKDNAIVLVQGMYCNSPYRMFVGKNLRNEFTQEKCSNIIYNSNYQQNYISEKQTTLSKNAGLTVNEIVSNIASIKNVTISNMVNISADSNVYEGNLTLQHEADGAFGMYGKFYYSFKGIAKCLVGIVAFTLVFIPLFLGFEFITSLCGGSEKVGKAVASVGSILLDTATTVALVNALNESESNSSRNYSRVDNKGFIYDNTGAQVAKIVEKDGIKEVYDKVEGNIGYFNNHNNFVARNSNDADNGMHYSKKQGNIN